MSRDHVFSLHDDNDDDDDDDDHTTMTTCRNAVAAPVFC